MAGTDPLEFRARQLALIAGVNPDFMVATEERSFPAWYAYREAARAEQDLQNIALWVATLRLQEGDTVVRGY